MTDEVVQQLLDLEELKKLKYRRARTDRDGLLTPRRAVKHQ
jgi:hypothetical protein